MPCDHFALQVTEPQLEDLISFLTHSLAHLDFKEIVRPIPRVVGLGEQQPYFWISSILPEDAHMPTVEALLKQNHIAFTAQNAEQVQKFHAEALKVGGKCNGPPGPRPEYHAGYYAAFVRDPACGINFEVVCHDHVS